MKSAHVEVTDQTIKETGILYQRLKSVFEVLVSFIGDEGSIQASLLLVADGRLILALHTVMPIDSIGFGDR